MTKGARDKAVGCETCPSPTTRRRVAFPCLPPQLLNSLSVDPDAECKYGLYFTDGKRKVDYVLVYHYKRPSGSRTLARRVPPSDAAPAAARSVKQDQPLPGQGRPVGADEPEPPADLHEDKQSRREEYEGNLLEAGLELEHDLDVTIRSLWPRAGGGAGPRASEGWAGGPRSCTLFLAVAEGNAARWVEVAPR